MPQKDTLHMALERLTHSAREAHERWVASLQVAANGPWLRQAENAYMNNLDTAERMVGQSLELQGSLLQSWKQAMQGVPGMREAGWLGLADQTLERRSELWQEWFAAARRLDFRAVERLTDAQDTGSLLAAFSKLSQQALEQQAAWLQVMLPREAEANLDVAPAETATAEVRPKSKGVARMAAQAAEA